MKRLLLAALIALALAPAARAQDYPVAIRWWGQAMVTIETYWGLEVAIDPFGQKVGFENPQVSADVVLVTHEHADHNNVEIVLGAPHIVRGLRSDGGFANESLVLDRAPNRDRPSVGSLMDAMNRTPHAVIVRSVGSFHDDEQGATRGRNAMFTIDVDGVRIVHCGGIGQTSFTPDQLGTLGEVDVLILPVGGVETVDGPQAAALIEQVRPRYVVPMHYGAGDLASELNPLDAFLEALPERFTQVDSVGNTVGVTAGIGASAEEPRVVVLQYEPWRATGELSTLLERMRLKNEESQDVFRPLSRGQMNHRPSNGTHTPRWNVEHMMGTQMLFFSAVYANRDDSFAPLRMFPNQMPRDYEAAHPLWTGEEEARQMQRAMDYSMRFAYLLDGLDLDTLPKGAPGFARSLRGMLTLVGDHYDEHTEHVRKKLELPDWPKN